MRNYYFFGRLQSKPQCVLLRDYDNSQVQQLWVYLLLKPNCEHHRTNLVNEICLDCPNPTKTLRQILWQLRHLVPQSEAKCFDFSPDLVAYYPSSPYQIDILVLKEAFLYFAKRLPESLTLKEIHELKSILSLVQGEVLEGWYASWCLSLRIETSKQVTFLKNLLRNACIAQEMYEEAIAINYDLLRENITDEAVHANLIWLFYVLGNRSQALLQAEWVVQILENQLQVQASGELQSLVEIVRHDMHPECVRSEWTLGNKDKHSLSQRIVSEISQLDKELSLIREEIRTSGVR